MALKLATMSRCAAPNMPAPDQSEGRRARTSRVTEIGRRGILLSTVVAASPVNDSQTQLLEKYRKKSEENKAKNDKERLDSYYKRNYKDYFEFVEGSLKDKNKQLTESEKGILDWLRSNK
ncbi:hypothetical protein RJ640_018627 [Escallonia rubra]|uniref:Uncharacterized protein n=1 Tax=Escallonia rubra TaxID=112253 RepID=A0AA88R2R0_9ASTE|nr:hypothetical protein RJ640_018627 [Escallonia rubra]